MNRIVSVRYRPDQHDLSKTQLMAAGEALRQEHGFLHYRLLEPLTEQDDYVLLTFWQSAKHYRQAIRQR